MRNNDIMVRERLRPDATAGRLDYTERSSDPTLIPQRSKVAGIDDTKIAEQLPFDHAPSTCVSPRQ